MIITGASNAVTSNNILDPDAIVIGGVAAILISSTRRRLAMPFVTHLFNDRFDNPLLKPLLGDSAGVFGAAMLVA
jgi:predicted NBD/HSP70 family sugar kinase